MVPPCGTIRYKYLLKGGIMTDEEFHIFKGYYERLEHAGGKINVLNTNERLELAELLKKQMEINRKLSAFV